MLGSMHEVEPHDADPKANEDDKVSSQLQTTIDGPTAEPLGESNPLSLFLFFHCSTLRKWRRS